MAAGLTDHVWTFRELLTAKFEPLHNQSGSGWPPNFPGAARNPTATLIRTCFS